MQTSDKERAEKAMRLRTVKLSPRGEDMESELISLQIHESAENYLETILVLTRRNGHVRSIDIASELSFSKPSVSVAMKNLRTNGYIAVDGDGYITLLEKGMEIAEKIYERHTLISDWLIRLGVDPQIAAEDACRIEHVISEESFEAIKSHASVRAETRPHVQRRFPSGKTPFLFFHGLHSNLLFKQKLFQRLEAFLADCMLHPACITQGCFPVNAERSEKIGKKEIPFINSFRNPSPLFRQPDSTPPIHTDIARFFKMTHRDADTCFRNAKLSCDVYGTHGAFSVLNHKNGFQIIFA